MRARRIGAAVAVALSSAVFLSGPAHAGGGCHRSLEQGQTEGTGTTVEMAGNCFGPTVLRVAPGTEVTWANHDQVAHRVDGVGWSLPGEVAGGSQATQRFDAEGTYPYACMLHPGMIGVVVVGDGAGSGPVANVATPTSLVAARPVVDGDGTSGGSKGWAARAMGLGALLLVVGFAGGRAMRRGPAAS